MATTIEQGVHEDSTQLRRHRGSPLISFIIPTYDNTAFLSRCIHSIRRIDYDNVEIIVVGDSRRTESAACVEGFEDSSIQYHAIDADFGGPRRKYGLSLSRAEYVAFIDDDDFYLNWAFVSHAIRYLEDHGDVGSIVHNAVTLVAGSLVYEGRLNATGLIARDELLRDFRGRISKGKSSFPLVCRREALLRGGAHEATIMDDHTIYMRAFLGGPCLFCTDVVGCFWRNGTTISDCLSTEGVMAYLTELENLSRRLPDGADKDDWFARQAAADIRFWLRRSGAVEKERILEFVLRQPRSHQRDFVVGSELERFLA